MAKSIQIKTMAKFHDVDAKYKRTLVSSRERDSKYKTDSKFFKSLIVLVVLI